MAPRLKDNGQARILVNCILVLGCTSNMGGFETPPVKRCRHLFTIRKAEKFRKWEKAQLTGKKIVLRTIQKLSEKIRDIAESIYVMNLIGTSDENIVTKWN